MPGRPRIPNDAPTNWMRAPAMVMVLVGSLLKMPRMPPTMARTLPMSRLKPLKRYSVVDDIVHTLLYKEYLYISGSRYTSASLDDKHTGWRFPAS
jgi:hypothetical protein